MSFVVSDAQRGTTECEWLTAGELVHCEPLVLPPQRRVVVVAPHPDDEVLGVGGLMASVGCPIEIIAITDGEGSHPGRPGLATLRTQERTRALQRLGVDARVTRLRVPDGGVAACARLADELAPHVADASLVLAPWPRDGHPDHDATGNVARLACDGALAFYPVWAWHWARPADLPWSRARRLALSPSAHAAKLAAIDAYRSQLDEYDGHTVLPPYVLARFQRPFEVLFT